MNYRCETNLQEIEKYLRGAGVVAFDFETAPLPAYRDDNKAALDAHRSHIVGVSLSVAEGSAIYVPLRHLRGPNTDPEQIIPFLRNALWMNPAVVKIAHNLSFEAMFLYALGVVVQPPCYDTIAAAQMTLKTTFEFRALSDSGLKKLVPELLGDELPTFEDVTEGRFFDELASDDPDTVRYACADSDYALRLYRRFNEWFDAYLPRHRWIVENIESPTAVYCGLMKYNGLLMDETAMIRKQGECAARLLELREKIHA
ncbi:MAG: bifunctional 3'-5' exonuclease/DNA polymerase, partial [Christensenellales bacterium]